MPERVSTGRAPGEVARRLAARLVRALTLSLVLLVAVALPASAHAVGGATPTNYQTRILSVTPQVPGLTIRSVEAGARLEVINETGTPVVIPGYDNEPYLRVGPDGVEENTRSPATYLNRSVDASTKPPPEANSKAEPVWKRISDGNRVAWHDHRSHWMGAQPPPAVSQAPSREHVINPEWKLDLQRAGQVITVTGDLRWVPGPSSAPWLSGAAVLAILLLLASRTPAWVPLLIGALVALVLIDVLHTVVVWSGLASSVPVKLYGSIVPVAGWLVAVIAILRLRSGQRESGIFFALFSAALALVSALGDLSALSSSQLVGTFPEWLTRLAIAGRVGLAAGIAAGGLIAMRRTSMSAGPRPSTGPAAASILLATLLAGGLLMASPAPASAQDREVLIRAQAELVPQRQGVVRVVAFAVFRDGDPAGGIRLRATATGGGRQDRFQLRPVGRRGLYAGTVSLRPGNWTIRIDATGDANGETTTNITVPGREAPTTTAAPTTTRPPDTTTGPGALPETTRKPTATTSSTTVTTVLASDQTGTSDGGGLPAGPIAAGLGIAGFLTLAAGVFTLKRGRWF